MENMSLRILINKGSSINTTDKNSFERIAEKNINLEPSKTKIYPYASEPLVTKRHFRFKFGMPYIITVQKWQVVNREKVGNILGLETARDLNVIKLQIVNKVLEICLRN